MDNDKYYCTCGSIIEPSSRSKHVNSEKHKKCGHAFVTQLKFNNTLSDWSKTITNEFIAKNTPYKDYLLKMCKNHMVYLQNCPKYGDIMSEAIYNSSIKK